MQRAVFSRVHPLQHMLVAVGLLAGCSQPPPQPPPQPEALAPHDPTVFEDSIEAFERDDVRDPPARGAVLFIGSSSVRMWKSLQKDMAPMEVLNRGFGGSRSDDVLHYAHRIVLPYHPRAIVFYAGDNDLGRDRDATPESVAEHFQRLVQTVEDAGQHPEFYFVSIKPSPQRMKRWPRMEQANRLVARYALSTDRVTYLDVSSPMLGPDGMPRPELFSADGLHMNVRGYELWTDVIRPAVLNEVGDSHLFM